jgi:hypothetical protein
VSKVYNTPFGSRMETGPPPPHTGTWGATINVFKIGGGCSRTFGTASQGGHRRCFLHWWWVLPDLQHILPGGPLSMFFALMIVAPGPPAPPPRAPTIDVFSLMVDDLGPPAPPPKGTAIDVFLRWWWALSDLQHCLPGARRQHFFVLMVDTPGPPAPPPRGPVVEVFCVDGRRSRISGIASQGGCR